MSNKCALNPENLRNPACKDEVGYPTKAVFHFNKAGFTLADAEVEANWLDKLAETPNERYYVLEVDAYEITKEEDVVQTTNTGKEFQVRAGKTTYKFTVISPSFCFVNALKSFNNREAYMFVVTSNNQILGYSDGTNIRGVSVNLMAGDFELATDDKTLSQAKLSAKATEPINAAVGQTWSTQSIEGVTDCIANILSATSTVITTEILTDCDGTSITGLVTADFLVTEADGTPITIVAAEIPTTTGSKYTLTGTGLVTGDLVGLKPPYTTTKLYETPTMVAISVGT